MAKTSEQAKAFVQELAPGVAEPFREMARAETTRDVLQEKLERLKEQQAYAENTYRPLESAYLAEYRERIEQRLREDRPGTVFRRLIEGVSLFAEVPIAKATLGHLRGILFDYFAVPSKEPVSTDTPLDNEIPLLEERLPDYLSFITVWIASVLFIRREFGPAATDDAARMITDMSGFYAEAGAVYRQAQSTFHRSGQAGPALEFLRVIDGAKNMFPSLHVEVAGHTYARTSDIIDRHAEHGDDYSAAKKYLLKRAVKIIESCLLVKQHGWRDIAAGLVALSARDPDFTAQRTRELVDQLFSIPVPGLAPDSAAQVKQSIMELYAQLMEKVGVHEQKDYTAVLAEYLTSIEEA